MKNLFAHLACIGVNVGEVLLDKLFKKQNPYRQKRGGFGYGLFAAVQVVSEITISRGVNIRINSSSPLSLTQAENGEGYEIRNGGQVAATMNLFKPPEWLGRQLKNGRHVAEVVQQHTGRNLVSVIGGTRCSLFDSGNACSFCSMTGGAGNLNRTIDETIEALNIIMEYRQDYILTFTTPLMAESTFEAVCDSLATIKSAFPSLPIALESQPARSYIVDRIKSAKVDTWMVPRDCHSEQAQRMYTPGKQEILRNFYWESLTQAVALFGEGNVVSNIIVGLEQEYHTEEAIRQMIARGVIPDPLPVRPTPQMSIETDPEAFVRVQNFLREEMHRSGLAYRMARVKSGCAACGGCGGGVSANTLMRRK